MTEVDKINEKVVEKGEIASENRRAVLMASLKGCLMWVLVTGWVFFRWEKISTMFLSKPREKEGLDVAKIRQPLENYLDTSRVYNMDSAISTMKAWSLLKNKKDTAIDFWIKKVEIDSATLKSLHNEPLMFLQNSSTHQSVVDDIADYIYQDSEKYKTTLQKISADIVWITERDSYTERVYKIHKFVWNDISYPKDIDAIKVSKHWELISDYHMPSLITALKKTGDCNNKTWLFLALCRVNGILWAVWWSPWHIFPLVAYNNPNAWQWIININNYYYVPIEVTLPKWTKWIAAKEHWALDAMQTIRP